MRCTPINSAEAIFEPFFDERLRETAAWDHTTPGARGVSLQDGWAFVTFFWAQPAPDGLVLRVHRRFEHLDCSAYNRLLVCLNVPEDTLITIAAETDVGPRRTTGRPAGATRREEALDLDGARQIHALTVEVRRPGAESGSGWLLWFGLQHTERLKSHLAQWAGYDERWEKYLQPPGFTPSFRPSYGLLINAAELDAVRATFADHPHVGALRAMGARARRIRPESLIGEQVNFWNSNTFRRERDMGKMITLHGAFAAQAGVLWRDAALCRLAARFALSIAHCGRWEDVFFAHMPGSTWEQRGFIAAIATWDCALILDLCGEWFTPLGRELILRRIASEAHGAMSQASWWWEYMYHTNQIAWISPGRLCGLLVLERNMPVHSPAFAPPAVSRVAPATDTAWQNLLECLGHALLPDGGYVEGINYFTWTARQAILCARLYGRARGRDPRDLVPDSLRRTARLAEMLCSTDDGQEAILTGDAVITHGEGLALLAWLLPDSHWVTMLRKQLARAGAPPFLPSLSLAAEVPAVGPADFAPFLCLPDTAMLCSHRRLGTAWVKILVLGNVAHADHQHEDKGSFVLECAGDSFAFDFGVVDYANPVTDQLKHAQRHNMLTPWQPGARPHPLNPISVDIPPHGEGDATRFHAELDLAAGWEGWFHRWRRVWDSPAPDTLVITDDWSVARGEGVDFHWTTRLPMRVSDRHVIIEGRRAVAELFPPAGTEIILDELPLQDPRRTAVEADREDIAQYGWRHAATQPRLTLRQRGASGRLVVTVKLHLKPAATSVP